MLLSRPSVTDFTTVGQIASEDFFIRTPNTLLTQLYAAANETPNAKCAIFFVGVGMDCVLDVIRGY